MVLSNHKNFQEGEDKLNRQKFIREIDKARNEIRGLTSILLFFGAGQDEDKKNIN